MKDQEFDFELDEEMEDEILYQALQKEIDNSKTETLKNDNVKPKKKKKRKFIAKLKKALTIKTVLLLLVTLIINTYAWFIYLSTVTSSISMHIKNWDIEFSDNVIDEEFHFYVEKIYPGMTDAQQQVTIRNNGETNGKIICYINSVKIFEDTYQTGVEYPNPDDPTSPITYTSGDLLTKITTEYPFKIVILVNGVEYSNGDEISLGTSQTANVTFKVVWPYETGNNANEIATNDVIDTEWGEKSYSYVYATGEYAVEIVMRLEVFQDV